MRPCAALLALLWLCAAAFAAEGAGGTPILNEEAEQRDIGALSLEQARGFGIVAEETEINFGPAKSDAPAKARELMDDVSRRDVPAVLGQMNALRAAPPSEASGRVASITARQKAILDKFDALITSSVNALAAESLSQKARGLLNTQKKLRDASRDLASETLGKNIPDLSKRERDALEDTAKGQAAAAADLAGLERDARSALAGKDVSPAERQRIEKALSDAPLGDARKDMDEAASSIRENKLGQALAGQDSAAASLEKFVNALSPEGSASSLESRAQKLADAEKEISDKTALARPDESSGLAGAQQSLANEARRLQADSSGDNVVSSKYLEAAADEMENASESLARAGQEGPLQEGQQNAAPDAGRDSARPAGEDARQAKARAEESQKRAQDFLEGAREAMRSPEVARLSDEIAKRLKDADEAERRRKGLEEIIRKENEIRDGTESASAKPEDLSKLSKAQGGVKDDLRNIRGTPPASNAAPRPGEREQAPANEPRKEENGPQGARQPEGRPAAEKLQAASEPGQEKPETPGQSPAKKEPGRGEQGAAENSPKPGEAAQGEPQAAGKAPPASQSGRNEPPESPGEADQAAAESAARADAAMQAATSAMERAQSALAQSKARPALKSEKDAIAALEAARDSLARSSADGSKALSQLIAGAKEGSLPAPMPPGLDALGSKESPMPQSLASSEGEKKGGLPLKGPGLRPARSESNNAAGLKGLTPGTPGRTGEKPSGDTWVQALPPNTPPDIVQSASGAFPRGYEETLRKYYEALAKERAPE